jgi:hypothetical protein
MYCIRCNARRETEGSLLLRMIPASHGYPRLELKESAGYGENGGCCVIHTGTSVQFIGLCSACRLNRGDED